MGDEAIAMPRDKISRAAAHEPRWWQTARDLHADGMSFAGIARACGKSYHHVYTVLTPEQRSRARARQRDRYAAGLKTFTKGSGHGTQDRGWWRSAHTLRALGWTLAAIGRYHALKDNTVHNAVRHAPQPPAGQRWCAICFRPFTAPPSDRSATCSIECSREHRSRAHLGVSNAWSAAARESKRAEGQTPNLKLGTHAAQMSLIAGPYETNQMAKDWLVIAPGGAPTYEVRNLRLWCERNAEIFRPDDWRNAYAGLRQVSAWLRGKTKRKVGSWKGWTLVP